jgi:NTP pyrophosphatase (non-canonical NTP hydrolase)
MNNEAIKKIADTYGYDAQSRQLIEEMAELTQAINKYWRKQLECGKREPFATKPNNEEWKNIVEEIADVQICIKQVKYLLGIRDKDIIPVLEQKLNRQLERIEKNE